LPEVSEEALDATGLPEKTLATYRLAGALSLPIAKRRKIAKKLGVKESTVKRHLSQVRKNLDEPGSLVQPTTTSNAANLLEQRDPKKHGEALVALTRPGRSIEGVAKSLGVSPGVATRIAKDLDGELLPLKRAIEDVRIEDLTKRFGTLSRDAIDAITPDKLLRSSAPQLAVIAGIAVDKFQLLRGQPTQRMEIGDRRQMNEVLALIVKEAKRRGVEIDVTPEGATSAKKSPYRSMAHQKEVKEISAGGDPSLVPA
jgi:transposase